MRSMILHSGVFAMAAVMAIVEVIGMLAGTSGVVTVTQSSWVFWSKVVPAPVGGVDYIVIAMCIMAMCLCRSVITRNVVHVETEPLDIEKLSWLKKEEKGIALVQGNTVSKRAPAAMIE